MAFMASKAAFFFITFMASMAFGGAAAGASFIDALI